MREHLEKQEGDCEVNEKKVVTVIVEGPSDENAIGGILKEFFSSEEVQFAVVHGDITSNYSRRIHNTSKQRLWIAIQVSCLSVLRQLVRENP